MKKVVKLHVHKNTLYKKRDKAFRTEAIKFFKECVNKNSDLAGYAVAVWDKDGKTTSCTNITQKSPIIRSMLPEHLRVIFLDRYING